MALHRLHDVDQALAWLRARLAAGATLRVDSRQLQPGDAFIAWPGHAQDGRQHVAAALAAGAAACLVEADGAEAFAFDDARIAGLPGLKAATAVIAHEWHGRPSAALDVIATTGTNGKTSTAWWTAQALGALARRCGVIGTLGVGEPPSRARPDAVLHFTGLTTPDPLTLHGGLRQFIDAGFSACAIEASSIGLAEHRLDALQIRVALYTNFTPDHLDYHADMAAYWAAKRALFDWPGLQAAVINLDDAQGVALAAELQAEGRLDLWTYALQDSAPGAVRLRAGDLHYQDGGLCFTVHEGAEQQPVRTHLIGTYNASNVLAVLGGLRALGWSLAQIAPLAAGVHLGARSHAARAEWGRQRCPAGGGRLRPHARRPRESPAGPAPGGRSAGRTALVRVRLRRQPRCDQAAGDGRDCRPAGRPRHRHQRQPAPRSAAGHRRPDPGRLRGCCIG